MKATTLLLCLAGIGFCVLGHLGLSDSLCVSSGCALYEDTSLFGIPVYLLGAGAFAGLSAALLLAGPGLFRLAALACVAADMVFLAVLLLTGTCTNCLGAGLLFFLAFMAGFGLKPKAGKACKLPGLVVAVCWLLLFTANLGVMARGFVGPRPMHGSADAPVKIFFSPTCPACIQAVNHALATLPASHLALFPVAKSDEDAARVLAMLDALKNTEDVAQAVDAGMAPEAENFTRPATAAERLMLFLNKAYLLRLGASTVPVVISDRLLKTPPPAPPEPSSPGGFTPRGGQSGVEGLFPALDAPEGCGFNDPDCGK